MKKSTRFNILIALIYTVTLLGGLFLGYTFLKDKVFNDFQDERTALSNDEKVDEIIHIIKKNYVDEINEDSLQNLTIDSLLHQLDPHSTYLPAKKAFELAQSLEGNFEGIGVEYYILKDTLLITNVIKDGPAYLAGVKQGDKILRIDSLYVSGRMLPRSEMIGKIKGKRGTNVQLLLLNQGNLIPSTYNIKRGRVDISSVDIAYMINQETGYLRISNFGANTDEDVTNALKNLKAKGMKKLILDLRDNGGGYVTAATALANHFLIENKLITYTEGKHEPRTNYVATGGGQFENGKLVMLINENSASASEIVAGAIQDLDRGVIIGRRSFGKGLVQEQFPFQDGSALNLTVARYFTPLGRSIQKSYKNGYAAYHRELEDRYANGELTANELKLREKLKKEVSFTTAAGKKVYGGGGIFPDIYVKIDTTGYNKFYEELAAKKVLIDFVFEILVERYSSSYLAQNINFFNINEADYKDLVKYMQDKGLIIDAKQLIECKGLIYNDLKVMLYKYHLGDLGYYKAINTSDQMIKQALIALQ